MKPAVPMLNVQIDGEWHQFPKGTRVIEACKKASRSVPHYCYHQKLSSPGNCRMCLVEMGMPSRPGADGKVPTDENGRAVIQWIPRPQISCAQDIAEGMGIRTQSPLVTEWRNGVLEFLLINHPLDCPICDQAGECKLQEYSIEYGNGGSRFLENKVKKPKNVELGPRVTLDDERCILCSRCVRFMKEVAHDDVLGFVERGSYNTLSCHPDRQLDSNYSLNTVDICPVGALTSTDFRFKMRVWFLKETKSICTSCGTGCNTVIASRQEKMYRQTPRLNDDVNEAWMCDYGRLNYHFLEDASRLSTPQVKGPDGLQNVPWKQALQNAAQAIGSSDSSEIAILASARLTNEELWLVKTLKDGTEAAICDILPRPQAGDDILMSKDGNPNTNGARLFGIAHSNPGSQLGKIVEGVRSGSIKTLIVIHEDPTAIGLTEQDVAKLRDFIVIGMLPDPTTKHASVILPGAGFAEKRGSMINVKGRLQRLNRAVTPPAQTRDDWEILRDLCGLLSDEAGAQSIDDLFREMAQVTPALLGLTLSRIGDLGTPLALEFLPSAQPQTANTTATA